MSVRYSSPVVFWLASALFGLVYVNEARSDDAYPETPDALRSAGYDQRDRSELPDSFKYYGPNGLWSRWDAAERRGRDMWIFWSYGNQRFYRRLQLFGGQLPAPMSIDFFRLLDSRNRGRRFRDLGLVNEPNCRPAKSDDPDVAKYGLWLDVWEGDPLNYYPNAYYKNEKDLTKYWGEPTGIVGLRKFRNPKFKEAQWDREKYFANPASVEPPYLIGITCALCHISFDPTNPPTDPESPRWEHLAANIGNQYFDEGGLFVGRGRVVGGDQHPSGDDPYKSRGLGPDEFLWHYGATQQRGTSETSRFTYDFINNPNTINQIFNLGSRPRFWEQAPNGVHGPVFHILKDGADSVPLPGALVRVPLNIGSEGEYLLEHLFNPLTGRRQRPVDIDELRIQLVADPKNWPGGVVPADVADRKRNLEARYADDIYGDPVGTDWMHTERRVGDMLRYLASYTPFRLEEALLNESRRRGLDAGATEAFVARHIDRDAAERGKIVFADHCARCHSSKQPSYLVAPSERQRWYREAVSADDFLKDNALTDDVRYPVTELKTNSQRAVATNATEGDVWANFSSKDYKSLPSVGTLEVTIPLGPEKSVKIPYLVPGGGRGYYRTASLTSVWSSAPFGHSNSIGRQPTRPYGTTDGAGTPTPEWGDVVAGLQTAEVDPRFVSIEGRLELFEDAFEKLLSPDKREGLVKVTQSETGVAAGVRQLRSALLRLVHRRVVDHLVEDAGKAFAELLAPTVGEEVARKKGEELAEALRPQLERMVAQFAEQHASELNPAAVLQDVTNALAVKAGEQGVTPETVNLLKQKIEPLIEGKRTALQLRIPKGTPINLFMNQDLTGLPYLLAEIARSGRMTPDLVIRMFELATCPDIVEDTGHYYGMHLSPEERRDLKEYVKLF